MREAFAEFEADFIEIGTAQQREVLKRAEDEQRAAFAAIIADPEGNRLEINRIIVPFAEKRYLEAVAENDYAKVIRYASVLDEYKIEEEEVVADTLDTINDGFFVDEESQVLGENSNVVVSIN